MTSTALECRGLPGIDLPGRPAGGRPTRLLQPGTVLLAGVDPDEQVDLVAHRSRWGAQPQTTLPELIAAAAAADLVGAGGAGFPTQRKLASMAGRRVAQVVVNGAEGESASGKDAVLLSHVPHLILDGACAVARAVGSPQVVVRISADRPDVAAAVQCAVRQRDDVDVDLEISMGPPTFIAGEASAVIRSLSGGPALPADLGRPPVQPRRGLRRRSLVFVSNVETFARLAQVSRGDRRTSAVLSMSGSVTRPGVVELDATACLGAAADLAGVVGRPSLVITGGWHGRWVPWSETLRQAPLTRAGIAAAGGRWGAGAFVWLPDDVDPRLILATIARTLADETAGQCGPCWRGLPEMAAMLAVSHEDSPHARNRLDELMGQIDGRGLCAHPTATVSAVRSALDVLDGQAGGS